MTPLAKGPFLAGIIGAFLIIIISAASAQAQINPFDLWLQGLRRDALFQGIKAETFDRVFTGVAPMAQVIDRDRQQPEFTMTFRQYLQRRVTPERIVEGRSHLNKYKKILSAVHKKYGVEPRFLVAIWGIESNYGTIKGNYHLAAALATLAFDGRRSSFFRQQLLALLQMIDKGDIPEDAKGSWAGAMGHTQFIPTTYRKFAVDFDGDGRRNLWESLPDVFASSANYLAASGWVKNKSWGREVLLPKKFDYSICGLHLKKTLKEWRRLGVKTPVGALIPGGNDEASIILPGGAGEGQALMVYRNFRTLLAWNNSILYAATVGHLADRLAGGKDFRNEGKEEEQALTKAELTELQQLLKHGGYYAGEIDGLAGKKTSDAIRTFQQETSLPADGFPNKYLLEVLRLQARQI